MIFTRSSRTVILVLVISLFASPVLTRADFLSGLDKFLRKDVDVISVTDMWPAGRAYPPATLENPVRYMIVHLGETSFGGSWAYEAVPSRNTVIKWMIEAMRRQGYLLADEQHPPQQIFVFGWGMFSGSTGEPQMGASKTYDGSPESYGYVRVGSARRALHFLGGDKVNLMWEQDEFLSPADIRPMMRGLMRMGVAGKVWDFSADDLFLGVVRSYSPQLLHNSKAQMLWETRFACPATGLRMDRAMPLLITAASVNFGRETAKPISVNATRTFGNVNLGEFKVLEMGTQFSAPKSEQEKSEDSPAK